MASLPIADVGYINDLLTGPVDAGPLPMPGFQAYIAVSGDEGGGGGSPRPTEGMLYPRGQG